MKAIIFAYHDIGCIGILSLLEEGYKIVAVFTHSDKPIENQFFNSVENIAIKYNIPVYKPKKINHPFWINKIRKMTFDVIFSFYYRSLLPDTILNLAPSGAFNLHGSLLPKYRGRSPMNWALINGEKETGITLHRMIQRADAGNIIIQKKVIISDEDNAIILHRKLCKAAKILLHNILPLISINTFNEIKQEESQATNFGKREPEDGLLVWNFSAQKLHNLVRAVSKPWPGAYSFSKNSKFIVWSSRIRDVVTTVQAGTILSVSPLIVACNEQALEIVTGQTINNSACMQGEQLAKSLGLVKGTLLTNSEIVTSIKRRFTKILILGVNGFIGNHLTERLLQNDNYEIYGLDISSDAITRFIESPRFHFVKGDISIQSEWVEFHIKKCDIILPLVAIATPIEYIRNPLRVFELDFEENLKIVRDCAKYKKRIIFPSTSEVYGMCTDKVFDEDFSNFVVGPIKKQRWIYSVSKQLLDRIIWAYGEKEGLCFTLFRPFNWIGPRLDNLDAARIGSSRAITQLIFNLIEGSPIKLIEGGKQKRCFTDINDGIEALLRIIENKDRRCDGKIINIGNPYNEVSIIELATMLLTSFEHHPLRNRFPPFAGFCKVESKYYYGKGYQDVEHRKPSIRNAKYFLNWTPRIPIVKTIDKTLDFFLRTVEQTTVDLSL